jgi:ribosomal protein S18 acetylase RimI-like enzyme
MSADSPARIRIARPDDADALLPMFRSFYGDYLRVRTSAALRERLQAAAPVDTVLLASVDGRPAGFASLRIIPNVETAHPHAELSDLFVAEADRRRGVGRSLMRFAERFAHDRECERMVLTAGLDNPGARAFYRAMGYVEFGVTLHRDLGEWR